MIAVTLPLRTVSEANSRERWSAKAKRAKEQRNVARMALMPRIVGARLDFDLGRDAAVTLIRIAPRKLDGDNLQRSLKAVRDGVADALGIDDGDEGLTWEYAQRRRDDDDLSLARGGYGVTVRIEART